MAIDKQQPSPITISEFPGMNNAGRQSVLPIILNMDATIDKKLTIRDGCSSWLTLAGVHSLVSDSINLFCAATGSSTPESIFRVDPNKGKHEISAITGKGYPIFYVFLKDRVFMSSKVWCGVYQYATDTIRQWGAMYANDPAIIDSLYSSEQLITLNVVPAPFMENLCLCGGRIWGSVGNRVYYNDPPLAFEMYRLDTFIEFGEATSEITMIAKTDTGMYFANEGTTWFGSGFDPELMKLSVPVGDGALKGSLQYLLASRKFGNNVPIWTGRTGIFAGVGGKSIPLTLEKVKLLGSGQAASLLRMHNGVTQYLSNFALPSDNTGVQDETTIQVFRKGKLV